MTLLARVKFKPTPVRLVNLLARAEAETLTLTSTLEGHQHDAGLVLGHEYADCLITFGTTHIALVLDVPNTSLSQVVGHEREACGPLGDHQRLQNLIKLRRQGIPEQIFEPFRLAAPAAAASAPPSCAKRTSMSIG